MSGVVTLAIDPLDPDQGGSLFAVALCEVADRLKCFSRRQV